MFNNRDSFNVQSKNSLASKFSGLGSNRGAAKQGSEIFGNRSTSD